MVHGTWADEAMPDTQSLCIDSMHPELVCSLRVMICVSAYA